MHRWALKRSRALSIHTLRALLYIPKRKDGQVNTGLSLEAVNVLAWRQ